MSDETPSIQKFYDEAAAYYVDGFIESPIRNQYEWPAVQSLLPDVSGLRVLDAACGPGSYAGWMAEQGGRCYRC